MTLPIPALISSRAASGAVCLLLATGLPALAGCSGPASPSAAESEYAYELGTAEPDTGLKIAALKPDMVNADRIAPAPGPEALPYAVAADGYTVQAQMQIRMLEPDAAARDFRAMYDRRYSQRLRAAVDDTVTDILRNKGFEVLPVKHFADITPGDAAGESPRAFLASLPKMTLGFGHETDSDNCSDNICTHKGRLLIDGQYLYQMAEPRTGATVAYRRMNLYGLHLEQPYTRQTYAEQPGVFDRMLRSIGLRDPLIDTRDEALAEGLHKLYRETMAETDRVVSRPRLVALSQRLHELETPAGE